jgi:hypothetical protein
MHDLAATVTTPAIAASTWILVLVAFIAGMWFMNRIGRR